MLLTRLILESTACCELLSTAITKAWSNTSGTEIINTAVVPDTPFPLKLWRWMYFCRKQWPGQREVLTLLRTVPLATWHSKLQHPQAHQCPCTAPSQETPRDLCSRLYSEMATLIWNTRKKIVKFRVLEIHAPAQCSTRIIMQSSSHDRITKGPSLITQN